MTYNSDRALSEEPIFKRNVFVYGSLKKGFGNSHILSDSKVISLSAQTIQKFVMLSLSAYPGLLDKPSHKDSSLISGEIYEVSLSTLKSLDMLEGYPSFYNRKSTSCTCKDGSTHKALIYFLSNNPQYVNYPTVPSGSWDKPINYYHPDSFRYD